MLGSKRVRFSLLLILLLALMTVEMAGASKQGVITFEDVAKTWVGVTVQGQYLLRVELLPDGSGFGGYAFLDGQPQTFEIPSWNYHEGRFELLLEPSEISWFSPLRGKLVGTTLHLDVRGKGWKMRFFLRPEDPLEKRWRTLRDAMVDKP